LIKKKKLQENYADCGKTHQSRKGATLVLSAVKVFRHKAWNESMGIRRVAGLA
jgi:hypothetical protein